MNVMRSFTWKSLRRNKKRTAVTIIGVIISVAMITAVTTLIYSFINYMQQGTIADNGNWHAEIADVQVQNLDTITQSDEVDTTVLSRNLGYTALTDSDSYSKSYLYLREYSANGFDQMSIQLTEGRLPQKSGEVLISQSLLEGSDLNYAIGDTLELEVGDIISADGSVVEGNGFLSDEYNDDGEIIASPTFEPKQTVAVTIVGIMMRPSFESSYSAGYGVLGYLDKSTLAPTDTADVYFTVSHLNRNIFDDIPALAQKAGVSADNITFNNELLRYYGIVSYDNVYQFMQGFMLFLIIIIVVASISLIYNAFAISVSERSRQLGLLASVGATRRQKRASVYYEGFFIGLIGIPAGILAGIGGIVITLAAIQPLLDSFINMPGNVKLTLCVPLAAIIITVAFSVITIFVSVYIPARRASKISPIDAIRQTKEVRLTRKNVKTSRLTRKLFGFEAEIALKNLKRSRKKYRATIISLVISLVLFLSVSSYTTITQEVAGATYEGNNFDISVFYTGVSDAQRKDTEAQISSLDLVDSYTEISELHGTLTLTKDQLSKNTIDSLEYNSGMDIGDENDFSVTILALDDHSFAEYIKAAGLSADQYTDTQNPQAILINFGQGYAQTEDNNVKKVNGDILNISTGDALSFTPDDPENVAGKSTDIIIGAKTQERPMGVAISGFNSAKLVVTDDVWESIVTSLGNENSLQYAIYLTTNEDQRLEAQIKNVMQSLPDAGYDIYNSRDMARSEQNLSTFLGVFVYGFIILISLICITNIFNTVSTNIALRRREFAMLRSVGMAPKSFNRMVRFESIFYGLKGLLYGLPISILISLWLYGEQLSVLGTTLAIPWRSYCFAILMILVIVFATMAYSTSKIKKENIIDALKGENI